MVLFCLARLIFKKEPKHQFLITSKRTVKFYIKVSIVHEYQILSLSLLIVHILKMSPYWLESFRKTTVNHFIMITIDVPIAAMSLSENLSDMKISVA